MNLRKINWRNRKLVITIRIILGLMFLGSGITGLLAGADMKGIPAPMIGVSHSLWYMGIFQMIKTTEIIAGLMLITGFLPALAAIFVSPICIGVLVFNSRIAPMYLPSGIFVTLLTSYLGYAYWDKYKALFVR